MTSFLPLGEKSPGMKWVRVTAPGRTAGTIEAKDVDFAITPS
jgi:hypothetical protein